MKRKTASASAFSQEVRELIYIRSNGCCDLCGIRAHMAHFHHRNPRRMGGSRNPALGSPSNGLLLHPKCHDYVESHRKESFYKGLLLAALDIPAEHPVRLVDGWFLLNDDGTKTPVPPPPDSGQSPDGGYPESSHNSDSGDTEKVFPDVPHTP